MNVKNQYHGKNFSLYNGDSTEVLKSIPDESIHYSVFSPPFLSLYVYSNDFRDLGNSRNDGQFYEHFNFIIKELFRVIKSGRLVSVHCVDVPMMKERDGVIGLKDFPGEIIRLFRENGFIYHSRVTIYKSPVVEMVRTNAIGLLHKQLKKDSAMSRMGLPDYVVTFRKPGVNDEPITHTQENYPVDLWQKVAEPVWMDIKQSNTLNARAARSENDERHIVPLQLDTIQKCVELWSNPGDVVLSPFAGVGSEIYQSLKMKRRGIGIELKDSYFNQAIKNCLAAEDTEHEQVDMFDLMEGL
jgi:DNA modification methylase